MEHNHEKMLDMVRHELPTDELLCDLSDLFRLFGDTTRVKILFSLFESEMCVCAIAELLGMTQSAYRTSSRYSRTQILSPTAVRAKQSIIFFLTTMSEQL